MAAMDTRGQATGPLAAVDIGSNSFRLEIAEIVAGRYRRIDYRKEPVRLGAGLDADGQLTDEALERGLACLQRFAQLLAAARPSHVRAVATQTLREARNRDAFLLRARDALGHPIEVVSGREEARLIYAGVEHLQPADPGDGARLVIDIGGRSTELILGVGRVPQVAESFAIGCVGLSLRYFGDGRMSAAAFRAAQVAAGAEFEEALRPFARSRWHRALGSSGTAGAVSQTLAAAGVTDGRITPEGLRWCIAQCIDAGHVERIALPALKPDRRAVLPGGLAILYTLATHFDIAELWPAKGALRQGVIVDLHARVQSQQRRRGRGDLRDVSVRALQRRFGVDVAQARRVAAIALALFDASQPDADVESRRELGWAAALHEVGQTVSHHDHHRHSAYLLTHVDAPGFSQSQQRRLGELALAQRGGLKKVDAALADVGFAWQALCLRLATIVCHARSAVSPRTLALRGAGSDAELRYADAWARRHPRTVFLLQEEAAAWARHGPLRLVLPE